MTPLQIFIGYDRHIPAAYHVAAHSILSRSSVPVSITPLHLPSLPMTREPNPLQSTEFSFSRFLVPYLSGYDGWSLFMDNDMLVLGDIAELFALADPAYAVQVVKHDHRPAESVKFLGELQTTYQRKNWSSVMLFNNERCTDLTPEYVNTATGLELHQFVWADRIGSLPAEWNHLVGYDDPTKPAKILHYTSGGPYYKATSDCQFASEWLEEHHQATRLL